MIADFVPDLGDDDDDEVAMPRSRDDCRDGPRPCPYVSCRYHLLLDISDAGGIKANGARQEVLRLGASASEAKRWTERVALRVVESDETCALDVAERGPATLQQVADILGVTREGARQIELSAMDRVRSAMHRNKLSIK